MNEDHEGLLLLPLLVLLLLLLLEMLWMLSTHRMRYVSKQRTHKRP